MTCPLYPDCTCLSGHTTGKCNIPWGEVHSERKARRWLFVTLAIVAYLIATTPLIDAPASGPGYEICSLPGC